MSASTFSGPLRSGTQRYVGNTNGASSAANSNLGVVTLAQSATVGFASMTTAPSAVTLFTVPAGTKILRINVEVVTAISGGSVSNVGLTIGNAAITAAGTTVTAASANSVVTTFNTGLTAAKVAQATIDAALQVALSNNVGTLDFPITGTFTAATGNPTAGSIVVTVEYMQRFADGTYLSTYNTY